MKVSSAVFHQLLALSHHNRTRILPMDSNQSELEAGGSSENSALSW
jgi:hypothetical protein